MSYCKVIIIQYGVAIDRNDKTHNISLNFATSYNLPGLPVIIIYILNVSDTIYKDTINFQE